MSSCRATNAKALSLSFCDAAEPPWALQAIALSALPQHFRDTARAYDASGACVWDNRDYPVPSGGVW